MITISRLIRTTVAPLLYGLSTVPSRIGNWMKEKNKTAMALEAESHLAQLDQRSRSAAERRSGAGKHQEKH